MKIQTGHNLPHNAVKSHIKNRMSEIDFTGNVTTIHIAYSIINK